MFFVSLHLERDKKKKKVEYKRKNIYSQKSKFHVIHLSHEMQFPLSLVAKCDIENRSTMHCFNFSKYKNFNPALISQNIKTWNLL